MSNAMQSPSERDVRLYAEDMLGFCERALAYTAGLAQSDWIADRMRYDATLRNLELIGEAATRVPQTMRDAAAHLPWRQMVATRNRLIHAYLGIDDDIVWSIISSDLPVLRAGLIELLNGC
jgi:uncharacterized protein with HEPN domain